MSLLPTLFRAAPIALLPALLVFVSSTHAADQAPAGAPLAPTLRLWAGNAPGALGDQPEDIPTLTAYLPDVANRTGASILILPGGGYQHLAPHEGAGYAQWFATHGIMAYVLKYRLGPRYHHPVMMEDAARAMRMVRAFAIRDGLDPRRVGLIGSSAGGHLAATIATKFDEGKPDSPDPIERVSSRPDLVVLCYPVITMGRYTHQGSKDNLLGRNPSAELVNEMSAELHVRQDTPPCFIWATDEDKTVPVENSLMFAEALRRAGVPFSLHIYEKGPHGLGMGRPGHPAPPWPADLLYWFRERKFIP
ncbi:MAG TPA: alpha/beta hydrolase [Opitutaceae bacterium]|nr:alpha/beta hydrolase [Opitutaceae bacterium]